MPPKREPSVNGNNNSENATTSTTNNSSTTALQATAATSAIPTTAISTNINTTTATIAPAPISVLPVVVTDAAAEQRTIAYQANAKLCRLVRKCPWMYDRNHKNYAKKHILDKSWCKIARECNDSVASCKERWRNIRAAFARSINIYKTHSGPNRVKPYYLHKELSFLVKPMMEGRDKRDDYDDGQDGSTGGIKDEENGDEDVAEEDDGDEADEPAEEEEDFPDDTADIKSAFEALNPDIRIQAETNYQKLLRNNNNNNMNNDFESSGIFEPHTEFTTHSDAENEFNFPEEVSNQAEAEHRGSQVLPQNGLKRPMHLETETFDSKRLKLLQNSHPASENDVRFLEALLPDMALMNTKQKVVFKRKIYQTLEEVFENSNDFPNIGRNKSEHKTNMVSPNYTHCMSNIHNNNNSNYSSISTPSQTQVRQTILTVNSSVARNIINNIASLNETELHKVNGFLQNSLRNHSPHNRLNNGHSGPSTAAAKLMSSAPKITITKVNCPPPAALRNLALNKPPSPSPATVSTTIHNPCSAVISSNVHSTTSSNPGKATAIQNGSTGPHNNSPWTQLLPITIKDEIEDVDIV